MSAPLIPADTTLKAPVPAALLFFVVLVGGAAVARFRPLEVLPEGLAPDNGWLVIGALALVLAVFALFLTRSSHGKAFIVLATFWLLEAARLVVVQFGGGAEYYAEERRPTHPRWLVLNALGIRTTHRNRLRYQRIATLFRFSLATGVLLLVLVHDAGVR